MPHTSLSHWALPNRSIKGKYAGYAFAAFVAVFIGLCCVVLPPVLNLALIGAGVYLLVLWNFPWAGLVLYFSIACFAPDFKIADAATVVTLFVYAIRPANPLIKKAEFPGKLAWPLMAFTFFVCLSFATGIVLFHNKIPYVYRDGRAFIYWLAIPIIWKMIANDENGVNKLGRVLVWMAAIVSLLALIEAVTGVQLVAVGRVGALETAGASQGEMTRVQMPGFVFVTWAIIWLTLSLIYRRISVFVGGLLLALFAGALYVNFGRALWIWTFAGVMTTTFFIGKKKAFRLLASLTLMAVFGIGTLAVVKPKTLDAVTTRLVSVTAEGGRNTSYFWRIWENQDAKAHLSHSPILGVGMGGEYRKWFPVLRTFEEHTRYIHNSYFFISLKIGIPGLLCLLLVFWRGWNRARKSEELADEKSRVIVLTCMSCLPAFAGLCITQPELMSYYSVLFFSCLLAVFASVRPIFKSK